MKQNTFLELLSQNLIDGIEIHETLPSKGKSLGLQKTIWILVAILSNGNRSILLSSRGTKREWASLDRLNEWLRVNGISRYHIVHMNGKK